MLEDALRPRIVRKKDLQKQDRVIARFSCYSTKIKSGQCKKSCGIVLTDENRVICLRSRTESNAFELKRLAHLFKDKDDLNP